MWAWFGTLPVESDDTYLHADTTLVQEKKMDNLLLDTLYLHSDTTLP